MDTLLIPLYTIRWNSSLQFWSPAKQELFRFPLLRWILLSWRAFPVRRGQRDVAILRRITDLARRHVVMIFPEGTRSKTGELLRGQPGVGKIIYDARPVVIPTLVLNTDRFFPTGAWFPRFFCPFRVVFGKPMDLAPFYSLPEGKETCQKIVDAVMDSIQNLKDDYLRTHGH